MHSAISINTLCFGAEELPSIVAALQRMEAQLISPDRECVIAAGIPESIKLFKDAGLSVATLTHRAFGFGTPEVAFAARERLFETIDIATRLGAQSITMTTGGRGPLTWAEAARRFADEIQPCVQRAAEAGVVLTIEPTSHLYADASIAHRLADTAQLVRMAGISLNLDIFACWFDSDIEEAIADVGPITAIAQISDYVAGDRGLPCRAVPGDGMIPFERLIPAMVRAGFRGPFDLEIIGPRLAAEGTEQGLRRAAGHIAALIEQAG